MPVRSPEDGAGEALENGRFEGVCCIRGVNACGHRGEYEGVQAGGVGSSGASAFGISWEVSGTDVI